MLEVAKLEFSFGFVHSRGHHLYAVNLPKPIHFCINS